MKTGKISYVLENLTQELSSDHTPLLLDISLNIAHTYPPKPQYATNWESFAEEMGNLSFTFPKINKTSQIDGLITQLSSTNSDKLEKCSALFSAQDRKNDLPQFIQNHIRKKRTLRAAWQRSRDPSIKKVLNKQTSLVRDLLQSHRLIQKILLEQNIQFVISKLPDERTLKDVLKGVPTDISTDEIQCELESLNFDVKLVKRFGPVNKPMPICLIIIGSSLTFKHIYEITDLFYVKVSVETYKKSGPSQCFACQRTGHGSSNCTHPLRCVKCSGEHKSSQCPKTIDQDPTCCNCGGKHTANYRGCSYLAQAANAKLAKNPQPNPSHPTDQPIQFQYADTTKVDYASATKSKKTLNSEQVIELLTDLLSVLSTSDDPKSMLISTIRSFITLFANQQ